MKEDIDKAVNEGIIKVNNTEIKSSSNDKQISYPSYEESKNNEGKKQSFKLIQIYGEPLKVIECEYEDKFNYFIELINIIIDDYKSFPNYFHSYNIEGIYRFIF